MQSTVHFLAHTYFSAHSFSKMLWVTWLWS